MFILTQPINIYSVKLITDMVGRYAENENSVCPMYGFMKRLQELWHINETTADICALFEEQNDFDSDKAFPLYSLADLDGREDADVRILQQEDSVDCEYNPYVHPTNFDGYVRHLEDLPDGYMANYLGYITYRVRKHNNGVAVYNRKHPIQNNFIGVGDNGLEITEKVDLISDYSIDREQLQNVELATEQLPFVVKRLHNMSRLCHIHILSFISSYIKAKDASDRARAVGASTSKFKLNDVIRVGVWKCDQYGNPTGQVTLGDKNKNAPVVFMWAQGYPTVFSSYYEDMVNYRTYCESLSIDILSETMLRYNGDFVKDLFVPTVTPNNQYSKLIADALRYYGVSEQKKDNTLVTDTFEQRLVEVVSLYQNYYCGRPDAYNKYMDRDNNSRNFVYNTATDLMIYQNAMYKLGHYKKSEFHWVDGLLYQGDDICLFVTSLIDPAYTGKDSYCIVSDTGYFLRVDPGPYVYRVMLKSMIDQISKVRGGSTKPLIWEKLG